MVRPSLHSKDSDSYDRVITGDELDETRRIGRLLCNAGVNIAGTESQALESLAFVFRLCCKSCKRMLCACICMQISIDR